LFPIGGKNLYRNERCKGNINKALKYVVKKRARNMLRGSWGKLKGEKDEQNLVQLYIAKARKMSEKLVSDNKIKQSRIVHKNDKVTLI
jgi:hypothetical protein